MRESPFGERPRIFTDLGRARAACRGPGNHSQIENMGVRVPARRDSPSRRLISIAYPRLLAEARPTRAPISQTVSNAASRALLMMTRDPDDAGRDADDFRASDLRIREQATGRIWQRFEPRLLAAVTHR